jgi:methyl-accepting chemotaxis protein
MLLVLLVFILPGRMYAQKKFYVDLVDSIENRITEVIFGEKDTLLVTKKNPIKVYVVTSYYLNSYINLINLYKEKDRIRVLSGNSMERAYDLLFNEYQQMSQDIQSNIEKSNGLISDVKNDIKTSKDVLNDAAMEIKGAQSDIQKTDSIITETQKKINSAIDDLQKVKKKNEAWKYTAVGVGAFLIGMLISR